MKGQPTIYLSPHYDDAVLACGGAIHQLSSDAGQPIVATVFAAAPLPSQPLSALAQRLHASMGGAPGELVFKRRLEDDRALQLLGAEPLRLDFMDSIYRKDEASGEWLYPEFPLLFGEVDDRDLNLPRAIVAALLDQREDALNTSYYAPMAVGHHVDHQLAYRVGLLLLDLGAKVAFYEDYPYSDPAFSANVDGTNAYPLRLAISAFRDAGFVPFDRPLRAEDLRARITAACAYESQLQGLPEAPTLVSTYIRRFAVQYGGAAPLERCWVRRGVPWV